MENKQSSLWIAAVAAAAVSVGVVVFNLSGPSSAKPQPAAAGAIGPTSGNSSPSVASSPGTAAPGAPVQQTNSSFAAAPKITPPTDPDSPPPPPPPPAIPADRKQADDLVDNVVLTIRDFRLRVGGNPVGDNAEITRALLGDNVKQVKFTVPDGSQLNGQGELCDPWGTPYFFHAVSKEKMEVRSAGADRKMWTPDDVQK